MVTLTIYGLFQNRFRWQLQAIELWNGQEYLGQVPIELVIEMLTNLLRREQHERRLLEALTESARQEPHLRPVRQDPPRALGA